MIDFLLSLFSSERIESFHSHNHIVYGLDHQIKDRMDHVLTLVFGFNLSKSKCGSFGQWFDSPNHVIVLNTWLSNYMESRFNDWLNKPTAIWVVLLILNSLSNSCNFVWSLIQLSFWPLIPMCYEIWFKDFVLQPDPHEYLDDYGHVSLRPYYFLLLNIYFNF